MIRWVWLRILGYCFGVIIILRNFLYKKKIKKCFYYQTPKLIAIGNLSLGGTGKTPLAIYIAQLLSKHKRIALLSRGYKRNSSGFKFVNATESPATVGDEPYLFYTKFSGNPNIEIAVCENRKRGIETIMAHKPTIEVILLDDAFQQLSIMPHLNILLTTFDQPFYQDALFPLGRLREPKTGIERADLLLVTNTPSDATPFAISQIKSSIHTYHSTSKTLPVLFTQILYHHPISIGYQKTAQLPHVLLLVTGIANPLPFRKYLEKNGHHIIHLPFPDHHWFQYSDIINMITIFHSITAKQKAIVTTEKDSIRLIGRPWTNQLYPLPIFYIPIEITFQPADQRILEAHINKILPR